MAWQRILGIDPGSRISGYALLENERQTYRYIASGIIKLESLDLPLKLGKIVMDLQQVVDQYQPDVASVENIFMSTNARSALLLGQARGAAISCLASRGLPVYEYSAKAVKKTIAGHGNATKDQVSFMVCRLLQIAEREHRDETDAMAIALCHAFHHSGTQSYQEKISNAAKRKEATK